MYGFSIDDRPSAPVGTPDTRRAVAIHWHWTTEYGPDEIAAALGVTEQTVENYLGSTPAEEVRAQLDDVETEVRYVAVQELKDQLQAAGHRSKTADAPVKVYETGDGEMEVWDDETDEGERIVKGPKVQDIQLLPDEEARYYARNEVRDILDQLTDLLGVGEPEQLEVNAEVESETKLSVDDETKDLLRETLQEKYRGDGDE